MAVWTVLVLVALHPAVLSRVHADIVFDFEDSSELSSFKWPESSTVVISDKRYKHGVKSLKWTWGASDVLSLNLMSRNIKGGVKLWIYNEVSKSSDCLRVSVTKLSTPKCTGKPVRTHNSSFLMSLNFTGWRAAWVGYQEFKNCPTPARRTGNRCYTEQITMLRFHAPVGRGTNPVYIDLLRWVDRMSLQSRDAMVPVVTSQCLGCSILNSGVTEQDALAMYGRFNFWQQTYRWSIATVPTPPTLGKTELSKKLCERHLINKRLLNWYADEKMSFIQLELPQGLSYPQNVVIDFYLQKRWSDLMNNIDEAYEKFRALQITQSSDATPIIIGSPLFCRVC